jgi:G:T/U-mismatch repair DNA glycosylase
MRTHRRGSPQAAPAVLFLPPRQARYDPLAMTAPAARARPLPDYLRPGLDLVFVGINPGFASAAAVCFNGKLIAEAFAGRRCDFGAQPWDAEGARAYVVPSTSARTAAYQYADKLRFFRRLRRFVEQAQDG